MPPSSPRSQLFRVRVISVVVAVLVVSGVAIARTSAADLRPAVQPPTAVIFTAVGQVMQQFVVPNTVTSLTYDVRGAQGAGGGGYGGRVVGTVAVTPGTVLDIWVGFGGNLATAIDPGAGGWGGRNGMRHGGHGGFGPGSYVGGGGGGATEVVVDGETIPLVLGGGGGGAGANAGVDCGSFGTGGCGAQPATNTGGTNGGLGNDGIKAYTYLDTCVGGGGNAGGGSGGSGVTANGESAATGAGGLGQSRLSMGNGPGGGGGGGYGGGGGGASDLAMGCGGGSARSLGPNATASLGAASVDDVNGRVSFTFIPPDPPPSTSSSSTTTSLAPAPPVPPLGATRFVPLAPFRLLDTREAADITGGAPVPARGGIDLQVTGRGGVPALNVTAVVLNVTAAESFAPGYVTIWPTAQDRPDASNLNVTAAGQNIANLATVRLGAGGRVSLFTQSGGHLIADVAGYYEPVSALTTAGRYTPVSPARILDTRHSVGVPGMLAVPADGTVDLVVAGRGGVPATGASAVVVNVTAAESLGAGFVTVWPKGSARPAASSLNVTFIGQNVANLVIVPLGADGSVSLYTQTGAHLIADVAGWFGDSTQPASFTGLFEPLAPTRLLDTRTISSFAATGVPAESSIDLMVAGHGGAPSTGIAAVVLNVTAAQATAPGFVTVWPTGTTQPTASNINITFAGQNIPNLVSVAVNDAGSVSLYTQSGTQLLADIAGYYIR